MSKILIISITIYSVLFSFFSCKDSHEYDVEPEFIPYLKRFIDSAAVYGRSFDPESDGLILEFADLDDNTAGLTHYERPVRIEFDREYWTKISQTAGADEMKENLVFHELGHGLLKRKHLNSTLENGDWKSIMCGGETVNERAWNINYKGSRRLYYIRELFDESTPVPDFSSHQLPLDTLGYHPRISLNFDNVSSAGWELVDDAQHKTSLVNGRLRFESKTDYPYLVFAITTIDVQSDFSYELTLEYVSPNMGNHFGILFGAVRQNSTGDKDPVEYFTICKNYWMRMGNRSWYSFFTEIPVSNILPFGKNKLKVFKKGEMIYYFVNDSYLYSSETETKVSGFQFGFFVPPRGVVLLDNFSINKPASYGVSNKITPVRDLQFGAITVKSDAGNVIFK